MKCAVLIVSGRPQLIGDRLGDIDALVASWLPGTEGDGVADVLYGKRAFTGQLPVTWPKSESQLPINVGDATYDPQFPYGWGLTTLKKAPTGGELTLGALAVAAAARGEGRTREVRGRQGDRRPGPPAGPAEDRREASPRRCPSRSPTRTICCSPVI